MDDDDFGGFEAAESYECGNGDKQMTSPAIPWAAFPTEFEVHISQNVSPDVLLEHCVPSSFLDASDSFTSSSDNVATSIQKVNNVINSAVLEEQELEYLLKKHSVQEMDFLKEKKEKALSHEDHYKILQEKHKQELEDMRKAGHEALSIIVEEFKSLLQCTVQQQEAATEKQYILAIEKHSYKCQELLDVQHQRLLDILEAEKEVLSEKIEEALMQQSQKHKEMLDKCLDEERKRSKEAVAAAAKAEKEIVQEVVLKAVEEERRNMEKIHEEERNMWKAEHERLNKKIAQAVWEAMQEQRRHNEEIIKEALMEERKQSEKAIEEAVKRTREELMEYIKEQKRLDQVIRQRNLSSLELFLSCAQKQLSSLLNEEPTTTQEKRD
ncbi:coiled-coil domain-containing protein 91 isoform X4 [Gallus gallus]|uniref:coiled-coil domain-containing protein 91 isoform X4 n=1 Tax=Gallus gallus TaxID=9031 RepID=UPI001AE9BA84|nr:coiled-coil domain-containing protein 91 isoform X4 [Gallus gallus]XP_046765448.1 coiled-coil domain-containing protein 91 isoform X4 [Gallus gallus]